MSHLKFSVQKTPGMFISMYEKLALYVFGDSVYRKNINVRCAPRTSLRLIYMNFTYVHLKIHLSF